MNGSLITNTQRMREYNIFSLIDTINEDWGPDHFVATELTKIFYKTHRLRQLDIYLSFATVK